MPLTLKAHALSLIPPQRPIRLLSLKSMRQIYDILCGDYGLDDLNGTRLAQDRPELWRENKKRQLTNVDLHTKRQFIWYIF